MSRHDMRSTRVPMVGRRFGKLVVLCDMGPAPMGRHPKWRCACDCGGEAIVSGDKLRHGGKDSCGCAAAERAPAVLERRMAGLAKANAVRAAQRAGVPA